MQSRNVPAVALLLAALASLPGAAADLTINDPNPQLFFQDSNAGARMWEIGVDLFCTGCVDVYSAGLQSPLVIEPRSGSMTGLLYLDSLMRIGINTTVPAAALHVAGSTGQNARVVVQNPLAPPAGDVTMLQLLNAGSNVVRVAVGARSGASTWTLDNNPNANAEEGVHSGELRLSKVGTGVAEFRVDGSGNGWFVGKSTAVDHVNTSSRAAKSGFEAVDEREVLERLARLPIATWRYQSASDRRTHMGPVAEDFQEVFGLSDGKHISTVDASGVAFAAIKGLYQILQEKDAEIAALNEDRRALAERLDRLERLVLARAGTADR